MMLNGRMGDLINDAHDSQVTRVAHGVHNLTQPSTTFSLAARVAALAGCGAVRKASKTAFSYGTEYDPVVATTLYPLQAHEINTLHSRTGPTNDLQVSVSPDPAKGSQRRKHGNSEEGHLSP